MSDRILVGTVYSWWRGDSFSPLSPLPGLHLTPSQDASLVARISGNAMSQIEERFAVGNEAYVALMNGEAAAWGWSASRHGQVGELGIEFEIPFANRYLWDFVTLPGFRGMGIYPRLLQEIVLVEQSEADRFWIGHAPGNEASARGILKAGFSTVGGVWIVDGQVVVAQDIGHRVDVDRAKLAADLMELPLLLPEANQARPA